jgi:RimJ/RimL family protein N-acetyltransferase
MTLRDVVPEDLPVFFEHQRDPEATRMATFPARDWDAFVEHWQKNVLGDASVCKKTIVEQGAVAGNIMSWHQNGKRLVGYWLGKAHWSRGVATAALLEFLAHDRTRPLFAYVAVDNLASIRVLEKCGFQYVGESTNEVDEVRERLYQLGR